MKKLFLTDINVYPVKSLGGFSMDEAEVDNRGLQYDRRWMLINEFDNFMTQRDYPQMSLLKAVVDKDKLILSVKKNPADQIVIATGFFTAKKITVPIWDDRCDANLVSKNADAWLSQHLKVNCRLVFMTDEVLRLVDASFAQNKELVSFADGFPFLLIGQSSLDELNIRMATPVPMNRFRTNFVFTGGEPFEEDNWNSFKIGDLIFRAVKPCARCVITTTDQDNAERSYEPLTTLSSFRKQNGKVMFGQNLLCESTGTVRIGDEIILL